ncbi:carboxypeptidase-like regulatory domain-containing protein [Maribellus maritimus]|uniref:carboxypeptidase-like regulatory domain-containing protein n=1 Tax=Maribellus maritimus TaxID=2870838 RepID=UPI001EEA3E88|nr:carboxypeptidase-like regulatory domain-containing protein [Maribellus maritimus]MCG6188706.1 carboxypeptidase-like regulatory domain-containing protein [Maribellus maritimus]
MKTINKTIFFFLLAVALNGYTQDDVVVDPMLIRLQAKIISAADSSAVPYANIVNNRTHSGTITNADGFFSLEMLNIDSLVVSSVGYQKAVLKVPYNYNGNSVLVFLLKPMNYNLGEVQVKGERPNVDLGLETGKPTDIPVELRGDAFNEKPPVVAALFSPISFWHYHLSKREKQKREVRKAVALEKNWEMHSQNYNKEMVIFLTGMTEPQADTFMVWFNGKDVLPYTSTEYQVRASILEYFEIYKREGRLK